jgi:amidase
VPSWPSQAAWYPITVEGPMARTVADAALLLSVLAGPDPRSPIAIPESGRRFAEPLGREFAGVRLAWSRTLGGLPVDRRVTAVLEAQRPVFEELGCHVEDAEPDFEGADDIFKVWRAWSAQLNLHGLYEAAPELIKETLRSDIERGQTLTGPELGRAERDRSALYHRLRIFLEEREFLLAPVTQVPPFDVKEPWVREIEGVPLESYIDWMRSCSAVSVTGLPAISVPCGFTPEGLPVGLQIVGRHQDDWGVLQLAHAFESATGFWRRRPALCAS